MEGTLKFDGKMVDTKLAETYLKKNDYKFTSLGFDPVRVTDEFTLDKADNKIFYTENILIDRYELNLPISKNLHKQLFDLGMKIEENAELFAELEALIRQASKDDVKHCDVKLISQNFLHCSSSSTQYTISNDFIQMEEDTPLCVLGFVAQLLMCEKILKVRIISVPETAAVCYLFTELCHQVGFLQVKLLLVKEKIFITNYTEAPSGLGIITHCSDVDSAVDTFLNSSTRYPWSLRRILIQESVYEEVKKIFAWKCKNSTTDAALNALDPSLKQSSTEVFLCDDKLLMFDYVGDHEQIEASQQVVLIEAYRTNRELMSLIKTHVPFSISLWCSDVAEANEIAFGANVNIVWVNEFGVFDGPPAASHAFYSTLESKNFSYYTCELLEPELLELKKWSELSVQNRIKKMTKSLENFKIQNNDEESINLANEVEVCISQWKCANFVDVQKDRLCIGLVVPLDIVMHDFYSNIDDSISDIIIPMINGQGVTYAGDFLSSREVVLKLLKLFENEGLPVWDRDSSFNPSNDKKRLTCGLYLYQTKVVFTKFGTIFAN